MKDLKSDNVQVTEPEAKQTHKVEDIPETINGYKLVKISDEDNKRISKLFPLFEKFVRLQPGNFFYPTTFPPVLKKIHELEVRLDDVYVITMPKSGTTWACEIVWTLLYNPDLNNKQSEISLDIRTPHVELDFLLNCKNAPKLTDDSATVKYIKQKCPEKLDLNSFGFTLVNALDSPRVFKTHMPISLLPSKIKENAKIVYVARDPRDVIVSGYHFFRSWVHNYQGTFDEFVGNYLNSELSHLPYFNHVREAFELRNHPNILFIYFEDVKADALKECSRISEFLGLKRTPQQIQNVVDYTNFNNMKKMIDEGKVTAPMSDNGRFHNNPENKSQFFRKGKAGDYKEGLTEEQVTKINDWMEENLKAFPDDFKYNQKK